MKKFLPYIFFSLISFTVQAQGLYHLTFEQDQTSNNSPMMNANQISFPAMASAVIVGGLNDLDGMGNYLNVFGSKLVVDSLDITSDGTQNVVLRREDGNYFFNLYPTMRAKLTPVSNLRSESTRTFNALP